MLSIPIVCDIIYTITRRRYIIDVQIKYKNLQAEYTIGRRQRPYIIFDPIAAQILLFLCRARTIRKF